MLQRAITGQLWDAPARRLSFAPRGAHAGDRLPFFTPEAVGVLEVGGPPADRAPVRANRIEVVSGVLRDLTVAVHGHIRVVATAVLPGESVLVG